MRSPRALAVALLLAARAAGAQPMTWEEAERRGELAAPATLIGEARLGELRHNEEVAATVPNPTVALGTTGWSTRLFASVTVPLPVFGQLSTQVDAARGRTAEAAAQQRWTRRDAGYAALLAWVEVWSARAAARVAEANAARMERLVAATREAVDAGQRPRFELVSAAAELAAARAAGEAADHLSAAARATLAPRRGAEATGELPDASGDPPGDEAASLVAWRELAAAHPLLDTARARERAAALEVRAERRLVIPVPQLQVAASLFRLTNPPNDLSVVLAFEVPLFNRREGFVARAAARESAARVEADALGRQLRAEVAAAWEQYAAARALAAAQRDEVLPAATEAADLALEAYRAGRIDLAGLLAAEQRRLSADDRSNQAVAARARALVALARAAGGTP